MTNRALKLNPIRSITVLMSATTLAVLVGCASTPAILDKPASAPMDPIPQPAWSVGMTRKMIDVESGQPNGYVINELLPDGKLRASSLEPSTGEPCSWTGSNEWFAPVDSWENCGGTGEWISGTQSVELVSGGNLWPLTTGAKAEYRRIPVSSLGNRGTPETRKCEVVGPVALSIALGDFDAMKVQCNTRRYDGAIESRIWYWTAEHGEIKYVQINSVEGVKQDQELATLDD